MALVSHASTHLRQYMHSVSVNFFQGRSRMGTFMGQTSTHVLQPALVHFTGSLFKPRKLNLPTRARRAPWGQRYLHQPRGM